MQIIKEIKVLEKIIKGYQSQKKKIGFVPTMGCLHEGHLSLLKIANKQTDVSVVSIFINQIQFNNEKDFISYPKTPQKDIQKLKKNNCTLLFMPENSEMNNKSEILKEKLNFGKLTSEYEAKYRPNHFEGVVTIVKKFFDIIKPHIAFFGEKDFQQYSIIKKYFENHLIPKIICVTTVRETNGLAMSSRNTKLSENGKKEAEQIFKAANDIKINYELLPPKKALINFKNHLKSYKNLQIQYVDLIDAHSFESIKSWKQTNYCKLICAVFLNKVRLIDNLTIFKKL